VRQHRAVFDFRITFANGGEITGRDFRLDVPGPDVGRSDVGLLLVPHLGLLMVDQVELDPFQVVEEPHRGGRGTETTVAGPGRGLARRHRREGLRPVIRESVVAGVEGTRNMGRLAHEYEAVVADSTPWWKRLRTNSEGAEPVSKAAGGLAQDYQDLTDAVMHDVIKRLTLRIGITTDG
jgi:hypothetical protein